MHVVFKKMSNDKITRLVDLANKRLNSNEDYEVFQTFVNQELDLDSVSLCLSALLIASCSVEKWIVYQ